MDKAKRSFNTGKELKMLRGGGGGGELKFCVCSEGL